MRTYSLLVGTLIGTLFILGGVNQVIAQSIEQLAVDNRDDFVVGPGKTEVIIEPGQSITKQITVTSRVEGTTLFQIELEDLVGSDDPNQVVQLLGSERGPYSLRDFIELPFTNFELDFGERITIPVTVNAPADIEPGGHYGAVIISNAPSKTDAEKQNSGAVIISRVGSLFLVRVAGDVVEEGQLEDFRIPEKKSIYTAGHPDNFEILFSNTGSVHLVPYGMISITNIFGSVVDQIPVDAYFALPESLRSRMVKWTDAPTMFGFYKAKLELNRGYGDTIDTAEASFFVLPLVTTVIALIVIIVLASLLVFLKKKVSITIKK